MAFTEQNRADAYLFFVLALKAVPGSVHGAEIARAYDSGLTTEEIVAILVEKPVFTSLFPDNQTPAQFAQALVAQVAVDSTPQAVRLAAIADIESAMAVGLTKAQVITKIMGNLQSKSTSDANWGTAIAKLEEEITIAKDKTEGPNAISATDWESLAEPLLTNQEPTPAPVPTPSGPSTITVNAGGTFPGQSGRVDNFQSTIPDLNGSTINGNPSDQDTLTLTTAGTVTINNGSTGGTISGINTLNLANGTNVITYNNSAGFTTINGGTGDDTIIVNSPLLPIVLKGGSGTDTVVLPAAYAATASGNNVFASSVTDFEKLGLTAVSNQSIDLRALGNYSDVTVSSGSNNLTLLNLPSNGNLTLTGAGTALTISNADFAAGTNDIINLSLNDASTSSVAFSSVGITASGVERVNISNNDNQIVPTGQFNNTVTWLGNTVKTINVSGNAGLTLTAASTALTTLDASGITLGGFTWVAGTLAAKATVKGSATGTNVANMIAATAGVDYTGGSGNDHVSINATVASTADMGSGNNSLSLGGATILGTYAGGSGSADSVAFYSSTPNISGASITGFENLTVVNNAVITANADQLAQFTGVINASGSETINLMTAGTFSALNNIERYNLANGTNEFTATNSTRNVTGGTGNDTFNFTADQVASTLSVLSGGLGNDILNIGTASTQTIDLSGKVSGVETINVAGSTGAADFINADGAGIILNYTKGTGDNNIKMGSGGQTLNMLGTTSAATTIMGGAAVDHINLSNVGSGSDTIIASGPNMSNNTQIDVVANFNKAGNDYFKTGFQATALGSFVIGSAETPTYLSVIAAGLSGFLSHTGQAFQISISGGTAAGIYLFQNSGSNISQFDSSDFFVQLTGSIGQYSELNLIA